MRKKRAFDPRLIIELRVDLEWTQEMFANYFQVSFRTVQNWELELATPSEIYIAVMQQFRYRVDKAKVRKSRWKMFQIELQNILPDILFGIGVSALLVFLFNE